MVHALALVLGLLFLGETVAVLIGVPIPGAALGLTMLASFIALQGGPSAELERLFDGVAPNAPLLFVPAAAGIVSNVDLLASFWVHVAAAVVLGTAATLLVAGVCAQVLLRPERRAA